MFPWFSTHFLPAIKKKSAFLSRRNVGCRRTATMSEYKVSHITKTKWRDIESTCTQWTEEKKTTKAATASDLWQNQTAHNKTLWRTKEILISWQMRSSVILYVSIKKKQKSEREKRIKLGKAIWNLKYLQMFLTTGNSSSNSQCALFSCDFPFRLQNISAKRSTTPNTFDKSNRFLSFFSASMSLLLHVYSKIWR